MMIGILNGGIVAGAIFALFLQSAGAQTTATSSPNPYSYGRVTPSMAIVLAIFIVVVFLLGFFAIYIRHCSAAARGTITPSSIGRNRTSVLHGLDPAILATFPTFPYSEVKSHKIGKGALQCAVCLTEFEDEETLRLLPNCDHVFHADCIDLWLVSRSTCPVCRANLEEPPEASGRVESSPEPPAVEPVVAEVPLTVNEPKLIDRIKSSNRVQWMKTNANAVGSFSKFPKSHSTGHCLVQPGEKVDRFTLKLPSEIKNQLINRSTSVVVLPTANSLRKGYRTGGDEASGSGSVDLITEDRWWWSGLFTRNSSSIKLGMDNNGGNGEGTSWIMGMVRQMSPKGFGSRKDRSGSVKEEKSSLPTV